MPDNYIIVKRIKKGRHVHHGGAWKIAYADFVTAMMAFFLLMWLINVATEETKKGIAEYFTTNVVSMKSSSAGTGMIDGETSSTQNGNSDQEIENEYNYEFNSYNSNIPKIKTEHTPEMQLFPDNFAASQMGDKDINRKITTQSNQSDKQNVEHRVKRQGAILEDVEVANLKKIDDKDYGKGIIEEKELKKAQDINKKEQEEKAEKQKQIDAFKQVENNVKAAFNSIQEIEKFKHNLIVELTDEGIKIQIIDSSDREMFKSGSATPVKVTEKIIKTVGEVIAKLPNKINITGHTDSVPYRKKGYGNWELSSDRAHSTRRILEASHVESDRFVEVNGRADRDPYNNKDTKAPENRRISITMLYTELEKQEQEDAENNSVDAKKAEPELP